MKHTKFWSCLIAIVLLVSCVAGIFVVGVDAESTTVYYTVGEVTLEGSEHFDTFSEALAALKAKNNEWGANEAVEIRFKGDISGGTQDGILFGLTTVWREDGTKLPITIRGVDSVTERDAYIYLDAAGGWYACANDYTFINLTFPVGDQKTEFYAGSGNVRFENVYFKQQNITIPTSAEQAMEHRLKREVSHTVAARNNADLLPAGDAWMDLIQNNPDIGNNLSRSLKKDRPQGDYKHDGDIGGGMYVNACVWYEVLTKKSCVGHTWRPTEELVGYTLDESIIDELQAAAHKAVVGVYGEDYYDENYSADLNEDGTINILNIGSSNGYYYVDELCQMLTADGLTARVCTAYHSGVKIYTQWTWMKGTAKGDYQFRIFEANTNTAEEISNPDAKGVSFDYFQTKFAWDSITFYQTSGPFDDYGLTEEKHDYAYQKALETCARADELYDYMRQTNPNARYTWYQVCPVPVGYPGVSTTLDAKSGRFYADNCTQEVFAGWPELKEGEKVQTSLTFGPGTTYSGSTVKHYVASVGYLQDYEGDPLTDETAGDITYQAAAESYGTIPDIRPVDVEASIIVDGGTLYRLSVHNGHAPSDGKILMKSGQVYVIDGDNATSDVVESFYGDTEIKVTGGTVTGSIYGTYAANMDGDLTIEVSGTGIVNSCIRGTFSTGVVNGDIIMTVADNAQIQGDNSNLHAFYGGGNATGRIVNNISGGTLTGAYFGIRTGGKGKTVVNNISGGTIDGPFYGGHYDSTALGQIVNNFSGGTITGKTITIGSNSYADIYGGGYSTSSQITGLAYTIGNESVTAAIVNNISGTTFGQLSGTTRTGKFYGTHRSGANATAGDVYNIITGGTFRHLFYGTSANNVGNVIVKVSGNPTFENNFYGMNYDATAGKSEGKTLTVDIKGGTFNAYSFLAGYILNNRVANVTIEDGTFVKTVYSGGYDGLAKEINITVKGGVFQDYFYGGQYNSSENIDAKKINIIIEGGTFNSAFFGGARGVRTGDVHVIVRGNPVFNKNFATGGWNKAPESNSKFPTADIVTGNVTTELYGGTFTNIYCGSSDGTVGNIENIVDGATVTGEFHGGYGGKIGNITNTIKSGAFSGVVYLGPWGGSSSCETITNNVSGGTFNGTFYAGGKTATTETGDIYNTITGGTFNKNVYLGGNGISVGDVTNIIGDSKGGPKMTVKDTVLYSGCYRSGSTTGNISNTFNNGSFRSVYCGSANGGINGAITNVFNGGTYTNSITCCGYTTNNGKVMTTVNGGTYNEYLMAGGRGHIYLPEGSTDEYCLETVINGGTFKGVWGGGEGTSTVRTGNTKLTIYGGTFNSYSTSASRQNSVCAAGRGMRQNGKADLFIYGGTFNAEVVAGSYPNSNEDSYAKPNPDCEATVTIYGGTFNGPLMANSKWQRGNCKQGTIILNPTESDIIINSTMKMRTDTDGAQAYEILGGEHKIILGADAEIEATSATGDVKFGQGATWAKRTYAALPEGNAASITVTGPHCFDRVGNSVVAVKGGIQLSGATMILTDRVAIRALFDQASVDQIDDFTFTFKMGEEVLAEGTKENLEAYGDAYYGIVLAKVGAKDFTKDVTFTGSELVWENEFSIKGLAQTAETAWEGNDKGVALAKAMQNFATIVADPAATLPHDLTPEAVDYTASGTIGTETAFTVTGKGLVMGNAVGIRIYGTSEVDVTSDYFTVKVNGVDVTDLAVIGAGDNAGEYTIDLYVHAKDMSSALKIEIIEKATGKVCLTLTDRVDAIAASYPEDNKLVQQLLVYIQAAVEYSKANA